MVNTCITAMRRVLHLKMVTQCAMLEDFGIFLVLADKVCLQESSNLIPQTSRISVFVRISH